MIPDDNESVNTLNEIHEIDAETVNKVKSNKSFARIKLEGKDKCKITLKALLDTGNSLVQGCAISEKLHKKLNVGFSEQTHKSIGTAKSGVSLQKIGTSNALKLNIDGIEQTYSVKPTVIKELSDSFNIGDRLLQNIAKESNTKVRILYSGDDKQLTIGNQVSEMVRTMGDNPEHKQERGRLKGRTPASERRVSINLRQPRLTAADKTILKGNTMNFVKVVSPRPVNGPVLVEEEDDTMLAVPTSVYTWKGTEGKICVLNLGQETIEIPKGKPIAYYSGLRRKQVPEEKVGQMQTETKISKEEEVKLQEAAIKELGIEDNKILKKDKKAMERVKKMIRKFYRVFGEPTKSIGHTDLVEFEVELTPEAKPVRQRLRPLNPTQLESLKNQLDEWQENDVIEKTKSPWASPLVAAWKKNNQIRWAVDYRALNAVTIPDSFPVPCIESNLERLAGSRIYSALDAASAYNVIPVEEKSRPLLAFICHYGLFTFKRMPFGARNAGNCYSRFVEMLLSGLHNKRTIAYLDDILCFTKGLDEHIDVLEEVLEAHQMAGIKLRAKKTKLFQSEAEYLGFRVSEEGIAMNPEYLERILEWPEPINVKELNTMLGYFGYYRNHIPKFAELTCEMNSQRRQKTLEWTEEMSRKFQELKEAFKTNKVRSYPQYDNPNLFQVTTDFSAKAVGAVLSQVQNGKEMFLGCTARKTSKHEKNYGSVKGELSAVVMALRRWEHLLRYRPFIINTDSSALRYLRTLKAPTGIYFRWLQELSTFDFQVVHRPGRLNKNADSLSRAEHHPPATAEEEKEHEEDFMRAMKELAKDVRNERISAIENENPQVRESHRVGADLSRESIAAAQKADPVLKKVRSWVESGRKPDKKEIKGEEEDVRIYHQLFESLEIQQDILYYKTTLNSTQQEVRRLVLPSDYSNTVFKWAHSHITAGHFGINATVQRAKARFFYPGMGADLKRLVGACKPCLAKIQKVNLKSGVHVPRRSGYPLECISVDVVGPLPVTLSQKRYVLTVQDVFTRFGECYPIANKEAATIARVLVEKFICRYGMPTTVHSDNGREFVNQILDQLMDRLRIDKTTTPTYNPQSNPVERMHKTLNSVLRVYMEREDTEWDKFLPAFRLSYNSKVNEATKMTPHFGFFCREMRLPVDLIIPAPGREENLHDHVSALLNRMKAVYAYIRQSSNAVIRRNSSGYLGKCSTFRTGDLVLYLSPRKLANKPNKIVNMWIGPYRVVERVTEVLYKITPRDHHGVPIVVHAARLVDASKRNLGDSTTIPNNLQLVDDDEYAEELGGAGAPDPEVTYGVPISSGFPEAEMRDVLNMPTQQNSVDDVVEQSDNTTAQQREDLEPTEMPTQQNQASSTAQFEPDPVEEPMPGPIAHTETTDQVRLPSNDEEMPPPLVPSTATERKTGTKRRKSTRFARSRDNLDDILYSTSDYDSDTQPRQLRQRPGFSLRKKVKDILDDSEGEMKVIKVQIDKNSTVPTRGTRNSAAIDIYAAERAKVGPGQTLAIPLKLRMAIPEGYCMLLLSRSGLASKGLTVQGGLIDSDFRGVLHCILHNSSNKPFNIEANQRVCQGVIIKSEEVEFEEKDELDDPGTRGANGFGSTGMC